MAQEPARGARPLGPRGSTRIIGAQRRSPHWGCRRQCFAGCSRRQAPARPGNSCVEVVMLSIPVAATGLERWRARRRSPRRRARRPVRRCCSSGIRTIHGAWWLTPRRRQCCSWSVRLVAAAISSIGDAWRWWGPGRRPGQGFARRRSWVSSWPRRGWRSCRGWLAASTRRLTEVHWTRPVPPR